MYFDVFHCLLDIVDDQWGWMVHRYHIDKKLSHLYPSSEILILPNEQEDVLGSLALQVHLQGIEAAEAGDDVVPVVFIHLGFVFTKLGLERLGCLWTSPSEVSNLKVTKSD